MKQWWNSFHPIPFNSSIPLIYDGMEWTNLFSYVSFGQIIKKNTQTMKLNLFNSAPLSKY